MLFTNEKTGLAIIYIISIYALKGNKDLTVILLSVQLDKTKIDKIRPASLTFTFLTSTGWEDWEQCHVCTDRNKSSNFKAR